MFITQLYTNGLSEAAYFIESDGEAAVIDPLRDIEEYLLIAKERNAIVKYIFETHLHADFVGGHIDLAKATDAPIIYGPKTETKFKATVAEDGQTFTIGKLQLIVLHTPGHTIDSTCFLLKNEDKKDYALFTGHTLFVGDVGRPDLVNGEFTKEDMASMLFESLQTKIVPLADDVIIYPAHGPGSSFGKNTGAATKSTIGEEKQENYALKQKTREAFIRAVTEGMTTPPNNFTLNATINGEGYETIDNVLGKNLASLEVVEFKKKVQQDAIILDTRSAAEFPKGFIPGAIFIGLEGNFSEWAGSLLPFDKPLVLVTEKGKEKETVVRLARVGFSNIEGYLQGGFTKWQNAGEKIDLIIEVEADELAMDLPFDENLVVIDVRKEVEFADGHIKEAVNIPLGNMADPASMADIEDTDNLYLHCGSGFRSMIAASLLKRQGIHNLRNIAGGWDKIKKESKIKTEKDVSVLN